MNIEEAIQEFEDNAYHHSMRPIISDEVLAVALRVLKEQQRINENGYDICTKQHSCEYQMYGRTFR